MLGTHLSEIELGVLLVGNALNLEKGGVGAGIALAALVSKHTAFAVESAIHVKVVSMSANRLDPTAAGNDRHPNSAHPSIPFASNPSFARHSIFNKHLSVHSTDKITHLVEPIVS